MKIQEKKVKAQTGFLKGAGFAAALALSLVFLFACGAGETAVSSPTVAPAATKMQMVSPEPSAAIKPAPTAHKPSVLANEPVFEDEWAQILVNPSHVLPEDFNVDLSDFEGGQVDARILAICEAMFADAKEDGVELILVDAYRSRERQSELFSKKVESYLEDGYGREEAETKAATITARPDTSEHQTGLALDIVSPAHTSRDSGFDETMAFKWLYDNADSYGFILRYPKNKTADTGVVYEPWHWRYVGAAAAAEIRESGECMEEYLGAAG